ncbi:phosphate transport system permease protein PstA [Candidatus Kuenenia stuttgartiensis]|jgi:phosphate transport system permease protein|uniref:Phosphate transport system permease protein PstA n=1 Tax=Kuenenia stuttgartiensis TaxID=174633 RepID=Q1Q2D2_KUEST|nr:MULTISPECIES: phosphate ABC transporter permease PstA [Kuenenia]MBE7548802.1 phosphate ABC transporter permease PstA [Planctomycetia bacterium]MBW7942342.1 phosphate ABC transporter permease PstA [Candidatus Kuenenia stuttgartiensis]MBZ0191499.1 phosphate ABC transporter permease PstA [Candidatus Kuenenia stuttgartiensis]MCF6151758.1 phosphate ABC transporter permease PstA [Candidatus Kuenenia stuttgartiensis]MCL4727177.1 phosphate ABC transporter permease PstA [Candidatus Kuenenia stuttgar
MKKFLKSGDPYVWLTASSLTICLLMVCGLITLIMIKGLGIFWPHTIVHFHLKDGTTVLGEVAKKEPIPYEKDGYRTKIKIGNRDIYGLDFRWIDDDKIVLLEYPADAVAIERREWGNMYGFLQGIIGKNGGIEAIQPEGAMGFINENKKLFKKIRRLEKKEIGDINYQMEKKRIIVKQLQSLPPSDIVQKKMDGVKIKIDALEKIYREKEALLSNLYQKAREKEFIIRLAGGEEKILPVFQVVRMYTPNSMHVFAKTGFYLTKLWEFIADEPREANTEGGIFPAIFGTVMMVFIMSIAVVPLGVLTAVYLKEYAGDNFISRIVRISVNNLAGVPSIVFGVFGLGFFIYLIGGTIDNVFFKSALPSPTFGTGGILWAALTLALLTVPVVVVSTEEGLSSVPGSIREGSYALGATKFETLWRVVLPQAAPGILTGTILAMARAAGEVAPLMITGVVKLAPSLPIDHHFPFLHLERKFMHLGFHIYDVGFQSPNVEAAIPMVYTTTLALLFSVLVLNITAIIVRNKLRKKYRMSSV